MSRSALSQPLEQTLSTNRGLQVPLGIPETFSFETKLIALMGKLTMFSTKDLHHINPLRKLSLMDMLLNEDIKFFCVSIHPSMEHLFFSVGFGRHVL